MTSTFPPGLSGASAPSSGPLPVSVRIQVMHALAVAGPSYKIGYVGVLRGWDGLGFGLYKLKRDEEDIENIERVAVD